MFSQRGGSARISKTWGTADAHCGDWEETSGLVGSYSPDAGTKRKGENLNSLFAQRSNLKRWGHCRMLNGILRFLQVVRPDA